RRGAGPGQRGARPVGRRAGTHRLRTPVLPGAAPGEGGEQVVKPEVSTNIAAVRHAVAQARRRGLSIGLVPTMGALHAGHASLIRAARAETGFVVVSLFVNPSQFGPNEDLTRYPRTWEEDLALCAREKADLIFAPEPAVMYPAGFRTHVEVTE